MQSKETPATTRPNVWAKMWPGAKSSVSLLQDWSGRQGAREAASKVLEGETVAEPTTFTAGYPNLEPECGQRRHTHTAFVCKCLLRPPNCMGQDVPGVKSSVNLLHA